MFRLSLKADIPFLTLKEWEDNIVWLYAEIEPSDPLSAQINWESHHYLNNRRPSEIGFKFNRWFIRNFGLLYPHHFSRAGVAQPFNDENGVKEFIKIKSRVLLSLHEIIQTGRASLILSETIKLFKEIPHPEKLLDADSLENWQNTLAGKGERASETSGGLYPLIWLACHIFQELRIGAFFRFRREMEKISIPCVFESGFIEFPNEEVLHEWGDWKSAVQELGSTLEKQLLEFEDVHYPEFRAAITNIIRSAGEVLPKTFYFSEHKIEKNPDLIYSAPPDFRKFTRDGEVIEVSEEQAQIIKVLYEKTNDTDLWMTAKEIKYEISPNSDKTLRVPEKFKNQKEKYNKLIEERGTNRKEYKLKIRVIIK